MRIKVASAHCVNVARLTELLESKHVWRDALDPSCSGGSVGHPGFTPKADEQEVNMDRPGGDYKSFQPMKSKSSPVEVCRDACSSDPKCLAYTYVKPGVQGQTARCYLKSSIPPAVSNQCCISDVKSDGGGGRVSGAGRR